MIPSSTCPSRQADHPGKLIIPAQPESAVTKPPQLHHAVGRDRPGPRTSSSRFCCCRRARAAYHYQWRSVRWIGTTQPEAILSTSRSGHFSMHIPADDAKLAARRAEARARTMISFTASEPEHAASGYRPDVDGLRAVAVLAVVGFHAFPNLVPGGYVGVDVFFVISGFLITRILIREQSSGLPSLLVFYSRRARRILPALVAMVLAMSVVGLVILTPVDFERFGQSAAYLAAIVSNQYFRLEADYFGPTAQEQLLLHTWSLSIEEQFYLLWPAATLTLFHPRAARFAPVAIAAMLLVSLAQSQFLLMQHNANGAFYQFNSRAWELLLGALVAAWPLRLTLSAIWRARLADLGLASIVLSIVSLKGSTPFPGLVALLPCVGTALVLFGGGNGAAVRLLAWRPAVAVGLISYSLYLWHWPLLVMPELVVSRELTALETSLTLAVTFGIAWASWRWVELPFRRSGARPWRTLAVGGAALLAVGGIGVGLAVTDGLPARARPEVLRAQSASTSVQPLMDICHVRTGSSLPTVEDCSIGRPPARVIVWGDSHASHLVPLVAAEAEKQGLGLLEITKSACPPLPVVRAAEGCDDFNRRMLALLVEQRPRTVILAGRWTQYFRWGGRDAGAFAQGIEGGLGEVRRALGPDVRLILWGPSPEFDGKPSLCWARRAHVGLDPSRCQMTLPVDSSAKAAVETALATAAARVHGVVLIRPHSALCSHEGCPATTAEGDFIYRDADHLTVPGAESLTVLLTGQL